MTGAAPPRIDPEFRALIPPLSAEELALLEANIVAAGRATDPLKVWRDLLLDGHNRLDICRRLGLPFDAEEVAGIPDRDHALLWIEKNQLSRRNLSDDQRAAIALRAQRRASEIARKTRGKIAGETGGRGRPKENSLSDDATDKLLPGSAISAAPPPVSNNHPPAPAPAAPPLPPTAPETKFRAPPDQCGDEAAPPPPPAVPNIDSACRRTDAATRAASIGAAEAGVSEIAPPPTVPKTQIPHAAGPMRRQAVLSEIAPTPAANDDPPIAPPPPVSVQGGPAPPATGADEKSRAADPLQRPPAELTSASAAVTERTADVPSAAPPIPASSDPPPAPARRDTRAEAARAANVPERKLRALAEIAKHDPEAVDRIARGDTTIVQERAKQNAAARKAIAANKPAPPNGRYNVIVIDPPWPIEKIEREVRPNQVGFEYPTMSEAELAAFPLPAIAADDCHLFCWTTQKFLPAALRLLDKWGFRYVFAMVWHKPGGFQPVYLPQYNCEFAIYGRKGSPDFVDTKAFKTCFEAPRRGHSRKPDLFYARCAG